MNNFILKILRLFRGVFISAGINVEHLEAIVLVKLVMDNRRHTIAHRQKNNKEPRNSFTMALIMYMIFGGFIAILIATLPSYALSMLIFFSYLMVMVAMTLITDFSAILLDTRDNSIILPRPVDSRTLFAARSVHILVYISQLTIGLVTLPAIVVAIKYGFLLLLFLLFNIILSVMVAVVITNALYLLAMRFTTEEKIKNVINYLQILMAVIMMAGYQLGPRLMDQTDGQSFEFNYWSILIPPAWMAAMMDSIHLSVVDNLHIILIGCAIIIPIGSLRIVNRYFTPIFIKKLGGMDIETKTTKPDGVSKKDLGARLSPLITVDPLEKGVFEFVYHILGRDRKIKLKIYPTFGYIVVILLAIFLKNGNHTTISEALSSLSGTRFYILFVYIFYMVLQAAITEIPYSDDYKASWIYFSAPIDKPGGILSGTIKAIFVKFFIVPYIIICALLLAIWGPEIIKDLIFAFFNNFLMMMTFVIINSHHLPLSMAPNTRNQTGTFMRGLMILFISGGLGLIHYALSFWSLLVWIAIPVQVIISYLILRAYRSMNWSQITY